MLAYDPQANSFCLFPLAFPQPISAADTWHCHFKNERLHPVTSGQGILQTPMTFFPRMVSSVFLVLPEYYQFIRALILQWQTAVCAEDDGDLCIEPVVNCDIMMQEYWLHSVQKHRRCFDTPKGTWIVTLLLYLWPREREKKTAHTSAESP
jgi:hypothetical protein